MADLLTLSDYKALMGIQSGDTRNDARVTALIPMVTQSIRSYTERDFGTPQVIETRTFEYDGSGFLDIDDASAIAAISYTYPNGPVTTLDPLEWTPKPQRRDDAQVYYYIAMPGYISTFGSPEMGFERNLDVYVRERAYHSIPPTVDVAGTWGWPVVPPDVQMAAAWTIQDWITAPTGEGVTAEAISGFSRSWGARMGGGPSPSLAIPNKARDILVMYQKPLS